MGDGVKGNMDTTGANLPAAAESVELFAEENGVFHELRCLRRGDVALQGRGVAGKTEKKRGTQGGSQVQSIEIEPREQKEQCG